MRRTIASSGASTSASSPSTRRRAQDEEGQDKDEEAEPPVPPKRDLQARDAGRRDGRRHPGAHPLLSLRRDGDHARSAEGVRLQDRRVPPRRRGVQDRRPAGRRTACARAEWADWWGFKMELFDGVQENIALTDLPAERLRDRAFGFRRRHPAPQPGSGEGDGARHARRPDDSARARDPLADVESRARRSASTKHRHARGRQDGRRRDLERRSRSACMRWPSRCSSTARWCTTARNPPAQPRSDFLLGPAGLRERSHEKRSFAIACCSPRAPRSRLGAGRARSAAPPFTPSPSKARSQNADVLIRDGKIAAVGTGSERAARRDARSTRRVAR